MFCSHFKNDPSCLWSSPCASPSLKQDLSTFAFNLFAHIYHAHPPLRDSSSVPLTEHHMSLAPPSSLLFCFFLLTHLRNFAIRISSLSSLLFPWAGFLLCLPSPSLSFHLPCFNINSLHFKLTIFPFSFTAAIYFWYFCIHHHSNWHHPFLLLLIFIFIITPFPLVYPILFYFLFLSPFPLSVLRFVLFSVRQPKPPKLQTTTCAAQFQ